MKLDARGLACPEPLIMAKKFMEENPGKEFEILTDNGAASENVGRFLSSKNRMHKKEDVQEWTEFKVAGDNSVLKEESTVPKTREEKKEIRITSVIAAETIGKGDDNLGRILMHSFLKTLPEVKPAITDLIFMNGGVKLVCENSELLKGIEKLRALGCRIHVCGTCLDFYDLQDKLKVGTVSNMFDITSVIASSDLVVNY